MLTEQELQAVQELADRYPDMDSVFRKLPYDIQQHGIRVAEYSQALYLAAVQAEMNPSDKNSEKERNKDYADFVYKVGKYHDIGVLCLPADSLLRKNYATGLMLEGEEHHTELGEALCNCYAQAAGYQPTILWKFLLTSVRSHHEKPDGGGFPDGLYFEQMSLCPWLVSVAVILDVYTAYIHSEDPFHEGYNKVMEYSMENGLSETELVLKICKGKLEKIFESHARETQIITYGNLFVQRPARRPMYLNYRRVNRVENKETVAYQAIPEFYARSRRETIVYEEIKAKLKKQKMARPVWEYFLYEASDMRMRMDAYGQQEFLLQVPILHGAITTGKVSKLLDRWMEDTGMELDRFAFMVEAQAMNAPSKTLIANLTEIKSRGAKLILTDYTGAEPFREEDLGIRFDAIQTSPNILDHLGRDFRDVLKKIAEEGYSLQADGIDSDDYNEMMEQLKFQTYCGEYAGDFLSDTEILKDVGAR